MSNILLVEDHVDSATLLAFGLSSHGNTVTVAHSVAKALELAQTAKFDVLVSDLSLPDGSGFSLLHGIRQRGLECIAIAMSGYASEQDKSKSRKAGFSSHLAKPVTSDEIAKAINLLLVQEGK